MLATPREMKRRLSRSEMERGVTNFVKFYKPILMSETNTFSKDFFKQFKNKEEFQSFFNDLFKQGVEEMLKAELDTHLGYEKHTSKLPPSGARKRRSGVLVLRNNFV